MTEEIIEDVAETEVQEDQNQSQENRADHNWRQAHEVMSLQKKKIEELEQRMQQIANPVKEEIEIDEFADIDPDDYVTAGKAREMARKLAEREAKKAAKAIVHEYAQQQTINMDEQRMRSKCDDYDFVIENYALPLIKNDPALAYRVQNSKNPAETAYKLGKLSDSYEDTMSKQTSPRAEKVLKNSLRPASAFAANSSLKTQADTFSSMSPSQVWEQSQKYARGA